jgi:hypothetical protein
MIFWYMPSSIHQVSSPVTNPPDEATGRDYSEIEKTVLSTAYLSPGKMSVQAVR